MENTKNICLIDGSGFIFRAYYALPSLTNEKGEPVGAVLGFCNILLKLLTENKKGKIIVIFDTARKTFRNDIYPQYKANRGGPPEDLVPQFKIIREAVDAFDITRLEIEGYEADDLIATYAEIFSKKNWNVEIISSDKDLMQLVKDNVCMIDPIKNKNIGRTEVFDKFGVYPNKVIDVQSLAGDGIDNVPGARGIGIEEIGLLWSVGVIAEVFLFYKISKININKNYYSLINACCILTGVRWIGTYVLDNFYYLVFIQTLHAVSFGLTHYLMMYFIYKKIPSDLKLISQVCYHGLSSGIILTFLILCLSLYFSYFNDNKGYLLMAIVCILSFFISYFSKRNRKR